MSHSYAHVLLHVIFGTKGRARFIDPATKNRLYPYMNGIVREMRGHVLAINGTEDHVHVFLHPPPTHSLADLMRVLKANSSRWIREKQSDFGWQAGYAAYSVSQSNAEEVIRYIANQEEHHRKTTFEEEYVAFLRKHGVKYDERYVLD